MYYMTSCGQHVHLMKNNTHVLFYNIYKHLILANKVSINFDENIFFYFCARLYRWVG